MAISTVMIMVMMIRCNKDQSWPMGAGQLCVPLVLVIGPGMLELECMVQSDYPSIQISCDTNTSGKRFCDA